jgi:hypothetical protein
MQLQSDLNANYRRLGNTFMTCTFKVAFKIENKRDKVQAFAPRLFFCNSLRMICIINTTNIAIIL